MIVAGRHLLPGERFDPPKTVARNMQDLLGEFGLAVTAHRLQVPVGSPLVGQTLAGSKIGSQYDVWITILERHGRFGPRIVPAPSPELEIRDGDVLVVLAGRGSADQVALDNKLTKLPVTDGDRERWTQETGIAKILIHPESRLIGSTLRKTDLRKSYGVHVLGLQHNKKILDDFLDQDIKSGDAMLVVGPWKRIRQLQSELHDFVVLVLPVEIEQVAPAWKRAPVALGILALMVALAAFEIVPVVIAVTICALLAVVTRCLTMEQAYVGIRWSTVVMIAGMMSVAQAMVKTGAIELLAGYLVAGVGQTGPYVMLTALFALAAALNMVLTGTASAILCAPIAIRAAETLEVSPHAFAMTVAIAASAGFVMPVSSAALMLVVGPGKYRLIDFFKVGIPLLILTWLVAIILIPLLFPFKP
jgi:di/tricarboxylate transporter